MRERVIKNSRKWFALICAILLYYIIHEGGHVIVALCYGTFEKVKILGLGVQVVANIELLTDYQKAIFCISGSITTLIIAYCLVMFVNKIVVCKSKFLRAISYYTTLAFLLLDPLYLTIIYKFVLLIGIPEVVIQLIFAIITMINILLIIKKIYPAYKKSFS